MSKAALFEKEFTRLENEHKIQVGKITLMPKITQLLQHIGWVLPGGKVITNKQIAEQYAHRLHKAIYGPNC